MFWQSAPAISEILRRQVGKMSFDIGTELETSFSFFVYNKIEVKKEPLE